MAQYSSANIIISVKDTGGTPRILTPYVRSIGGVSIESVIQESTAFGDTWQKSVSAAISKMAAITLGGFYDTAATVGPDVLFAGKQGETRTGCIITWGGTKTTTFDAIIQKYERLPKLGGMTEYSVTLQPTGTVVEA